MRDRVMAVLRSVLLLSLLSMPLRVYENVSWFGRQEIGVLQSLQHAGAVVVLRPLAGEQWSIFPSDKRLPQALQIVQPGASYIAVNFEQLNLLTGDKLVVRDLNGARSITVVPGNASSLVEEHCNTSPHSLLLRTHPFLVQGDTVVIEYIPSIMTLMLPMVPRQREEAVVVMNTYAYIVDNSGSGEGVDTESTVGATDEAKEAICYRKSQPKMYAKARAVARLMIRTEQTPQERTFKNDEQVTSWAFCTGWLIGRGNHLLTNHHCMKDAAIAEQDAKFSRKTREKPNPDFLSSTLSRLWPYTSSPANKTGRTMETVVGFMAETKSCRDTGFMGEKVGVVEATRVVLVSENPELDYALLRVLTNDSDVDLSRRYGFLRLRADGPVDGETIYIPQHPRGEPKEIAAIKDGKPAVIEVSTGSSMSSEFLRRDSKTSDTQPTVWYNADTKPGSSGSPVLSRKDNVVVALHRAGSSETAQSASTEVFNMGIRIDLIARDLQRRNVLPKSALAS